MKLSKTRPRFDALPDRLVVLIMMVFVLSHFSWPDVLRTERCERQFQASVDQMVLQLQAFQTAMDGHLKVKLSDLVTETADPPTDDAPSASDKSVELVRQFVRRLLSDTQS